MILKIVSQIVFTIQIPKLNGVILGERTILIWCIIPESVCYLINSFMICKTV